MTNLEKLNQEGRNRIRILEKINLGEHFFDYDEMYIADGKIRRLKAQEMDIVKNFENNHDGLVYFLNKLKIGKDEVINLFVVSAEEDNWEKERKALEEWNPRVFSCKLNDSENLVETDIFIDRTLNRTA